MLFVYKTGIPFKYKDNEGADKGLEYSTAIVKDLVSKDTDADGILDWEESLWGTNPTLKETTPGTPDSTAIAKLKTEQGIKNKTAGGDKKETENLTATDKFSRELFSTVTALNQEGALDQSTVEKISDSLSKGIQNPSPGKVFTTADIVITEDNGSKAMQDYNAGMGVILYNKYPMHEKIINILKDSLTEEGDINSDILLKFDPLIGQLEGIVTAMTKIKTPRRLVVSHLKLLNAFEKIAENLIDIQKIDSDPVVTMGAINQYMTNNDQADSSVQELASIIKSNI